MVSANWVDMLRDATPEQSERLMKAMLKMKKFDMAALQRAYDAK